MQNVLEKTNVKTIDFNCDLAQSYGVYKNDFEFELLDYVSSVNISCGFHAGDPLSIKNALLKAKEKNIVLGAHIGFDDIAGFGYRPVSMTDDELEALVIYQVGALMSFAKCYKMEIETVRPHGAMYKLAGEDFHFAKTIVGAIKKCSNWLTYVGPVGDNTEKAGELHNIHVAHELLPEKTYNFDMTINYGYPDNFKTDFIINRLRKYLETSQIEHNESGLTVAKIDTVHFTGRALNAIEILKAANELIKPEPVNYAKIKQSGWVE